MAVYVVLKLLGADKRGRIRLVPIGIAFLNLLFVILLIRIGSGHYDQLISISTGMSVDAVTMGRRVLYAQVLGFIQDISWLGIGLGKTTQILSSIGYELQNLHSDLLKYFLEFGPILFGVWIYGLYRLNTLSPRLITMLVYLNILFITDNVSIYFNVMFLFYLLQAFILSDEYIQSQTISVSQARNPVT